MSDSTSKWEMTVEQKEALKKLHRLGIWKEIWDERDEGAHFNDWWYSVAFTTDTWSEYEQGDWREPKFMSDTCYRSAVRWMNEYEHLLDKDYETARAKGEI